MGISQKLNGFFSKLDKKELFFVFLLFLLAFGVRARMMRFGLMWEFDTYFHARMAGEVIQNNFAVPQFDPMAYYFMVNSVPNSAVFFWLLSAAIYKIFTLGAPYNKELWIVFVKALPAIYGALTSAAMYYLGKELYGRKAGYVMAFFAATVPAFVYRTMAGQFEGQSLGFLWLVIGFIFLVRAVKHLDFNKTSIRNAILAGVFFGLMAWSWAAFLMVPLILIGYFFSSLIVFWFKNTPFEKIINFAKVVIISSLVFSFLATLFVGTAWIGSTFNNITKYVPITPQSISGAQDNSSTNVLAATVGEENTGKQFFGEKYSALIVFPILALLLIPINLIRKKDYATSLLIFAWTVLALYMAWTKLKFTFIFGLPVAASAGFVFHEIFHYLKSRSNLEKKIVGVVLGFMLLVGAGAASIFMVTKVPTIEMDTGWKDTLYWLKGNTPTDAKMFNWWDEGHWITFIAERRVLLDNRNISGEAETDYARFLLNEDENGSYKLVKKYDSDYVIVSSDALGSLGSYGLYAYNTTNFNDEKIAKYFEVAFNCNEQTDSLTGKKTFACGPNSLTGEQMATIPSKWVSSPNQLIDKKVPGVVYKSEDNSALYILNMPTNASFAAKLWFDSEGLNHFKEVYHNKTVKVFKVLN